MNMIISISMCISYFFWIDVRKPVVSSYFFRVFQNQSSDRISDICIFINPPVKIVEIFAHSFFYFYDNVLIGSWFSSLLSVDDKRFGNGIMTFFDQNLFYHILDNFDIGNIFVYLFFDFITCFFGKIRNFWKICSTHSFDSFFDGSFNLADVKINNRSVSFSYFVDSHTILL